MTPTPRRLLPAYLLAAILAALCVITAATQFEAGHVARAVPLLVLSLMAPAAALVLRRSTSTGDRLVAGLLFTHGVSGGLSAIQLLSTPDLPPRAARGYDAYAFVLDIAWVAAGVLAVRMMQHFPRPVAEDALVGVRSRHWRLLLQAFVRSRWQLVLGGSLFGAALLGAWGLGNLIVAVLAISYGYYNVRVASEVERRKLFWMVFSGAAFFSLTAVWLAFQAAGRALDMAPATIEAVGHVVWNLIGVVALAGPVLAVLAAPTINPRPWIQHTALYGATLSALLFTFAVIENVLADAVTQALNVSSGLISAVVGGTLAMLLQPLHQRLESSMRSAIGSWRARRTAQTTQTMSAIQ